ncbi:YkgJ family cysteine cluster protein [Paraflavitalea sp. CAU 1676]|uniref:YkgJ family cysteine cluster protein n=1 Tax=Paraflavitalea sp. CAU 1676 TaxID=3032598 RepID=UPI0023DCA61A|nr:YkgJ family cysteine cluster protein [Paraflavitalea sp. CAU 1676]MDF2191818.1 YkgJ family cysteine cluster protein [Paraflavitalea sp. CAU 1676]
MPFNLRTYKKTMLLNRSAFRRFLTKLEKNPPRKLDQMAVETDVEVWKEMDCLACANCCKTMSPTFTQVDIKRIATHLNMGAEEFKKKWLYKDRNGDWINKSQPCQFLNLEDNKCSIYEVRPKDCSGFPHHTKRRMVDYMHVFKQNVEYCPATYKLVEKMIEKVNAK